MADTMQALVRVAGERQAMPMAVTVRKAVFAQENATITAIITV
jgi:hypothetical protein